MRCPGCQAELPPPKDLLARTVRCTACGHDADLAASAPLEGTIQAPPPAAPAAPGPDPLVGRTIAGGRYRIEALLGVGGMGRVYRATQVALGRAVAVKMLSPELAGDEMFRRRFDREAGLLASLDHPHIVAVHDMGVEDDTPYIVMAVVLGPEGRPVTLRALLDGGPVEEDLCLRVIQQTCAALDYAHKKGVVHRDIKPANILIDARGEAKIADFGIARASGAEAAALTTTGAVLGTLRYMAPEQMADSSRADPRSDLYSLGVVFYEMLTGHAPVGRFELPSEARAGLDRRLDGIVDRALRRAADQRYQSADQMARDLSRITTERDLARLGAAAAPADREARAAAAPAAAAAARGTPAPAPAAPAAPAARAPAPGGGGPAAARRGVPRPVLAAIALVAVGAATFPLWRPGRPSPDGPGPTPRSAEVGRDAPAMGDPAMDAPAMDAPAMGDPAMGTAAMDGPAMDTPAMGDIPAMGSTWATDMPAPMDEPPPKAGGPALPAPEAELAAHRATLLTLAAGAGLSAEDVGSTRDLAAKFPSSAKADVKGARAALDAWLAARARADWAALDAALPAEVVRATAASHANGSTTEVRQLFRAAYEETSVRGPKVTELYGVGADWALARLEGTEDDTDDAVDGAALMILEQGAWKVVVYW